MTAEAGSQSGKAHKAQKFGKPVLSADEFFARLASRGIIDGTISKA